MKHYKLLLFTFFLCLSIFFLGGCTKQYKYQTLRLRLWVHYNSNADSLKRQAAKFLMDCISDRYSIEGKRVRAYSDTTLKYYNNGDVLNKKLCELRELKYTDSVVLDIDALSTRYLIDNIDRAFEAWQQAPWKNDIAFSDFCEYVLPYRNGNEPIENWRKVVFNDSILGSVKDSAFKYTDMLGAARYVALEQSKQAINFKLKMLGNSNANLPDLNFSVVNILSTGTCENLAAKSIFTNRAMAIPIANDFTPHWANKPFGHNWVAVICPKKSVPFILPVKDSLGYPIDPKIKNIPSKIYRRTYSVNGNSHLALRGYCSFLPELFNNSRLIDVTDLYLKTHDISIPVDESDNKYAYLAVADRNEWVPVGWGVCANNKANFNKVGEKAVYLPMFINETAAEPCGDAFVIADSGRMRIFEPDVENLRKVVLTRKYPISNIKWVERMQSMLKGKFQVSNNPDFKNARTVYTITEFPGVYYNNIELNLPGKYRYVRYLGGDTLPTTIAEMEVYGKNNTLIKGSIIGTGSTTSLENVFDGNVLSFLELWIPTKTWIPYIGLDLGEPISISKIRFSANNDKNHIIEGNDYELFYWDYQWISLGRRIADSHELGYTNVPSNCLLLLRNYTEGVEERPFTYENDTQIWW